MFFERVCNICGFYQCSINKNEMKIISNWTCRRCYMKYIANPKITSEQRKKYNLLRNKSKINEDNKRVMLFINKRIHLKNNPRKGKCSSCGLKIGDTYINKHRKLIAIKQTQMHHFIYHYDDPLKDAIEVCVRCHREKHKSK